VFPVTTPHSIPNRTTRGSAKSRRYHLTMRCSARRISHFAPLRETQRRGHAFPCHGRSKPRCSTRAQSRASARTMANETRSGRENTPSWILAGFRGRWAGFDVALARFVLHDPGNGDCHARCNPCFGTCSGPGLGLHRHDGGSVAYRFGRNPNSWMPSLISPR
jgi:hypothetical protein